MPRIHQEVKFASTPSKVYSALVDSKEHAAFTGGPAEIGTGEGDAFSAHGGHVLGRNIELVRNKRIVQAWRAADWPDGVYSILKLELSEDGAATRLVLDQDGVPEDATSQIDAGWQAMYWTPLRDYLQQ